MLIVNFIHVTTAKNCWEVALPVRNFLASAMDFISMQMSKVNREKGNRTTLADL